MYLEIDFEVTYKDGVHKHYTQFITLKSGDELSADVQWFVNHIFNVSSVRIIKSRIVRERMNNW